MRIFPTIENNPLAVDDLSLLPDGLIEVKYSISRVFDTEKQFQTLEANFGDGYIQRERKDITTGREIYNLTWNNRKIDVIQDIWNFLTAVGTHETFVWQNPETKKYVRVKMSGNPSKSTQAGGDDLIGTITATFIEVFEV